MRSALILYALPNARYSKFINVWLSDRHRYSESSSHMNILVVVGGQRHCADGVSVFVHFTYILLCFIRCDCMVVSFGTMRFLIVLSTSNAYTMCTIRHLCHHVSLSLSLSLTIFLSLSDTWNSRIFCIISLTTALAIASWHISIAPATGNRNRNDCKNAPRILPFFFHVHAHWIPTYTIRLGKHLNQIVSVLWRLSSWTKLTHSISIWGYIDASSLHVSKLIF